MMGLFSCFKPSTSVDPFEAETGIAITVSLREAEIQEAELLASAIQESSLLCQREEEQQKRRTRELENDAQIAHAFQYEEGERQIDDKSAVEDKEDEQLAKTLAESLKDKGKRKQFEEHVTKDKQIAQDIQNRFSKVAYEESSELHDNRVMDVKDEQLAKTVKNSLKEKGKEKQSEDEQVKKDEQFAVIVQESLNTVESPELEENKNTSTRVALDEDEQRIIWESLEGKGQLKQSTNEVEENGKLPKVKPPPSMCGGCNFEIEHGRSVDVLGVLWHPKCFCCDACEKPIAIGVVFNHVSNSRGKFHKSCYERFCYVCKEKKMKMYSEHRFWKERYCPAHETDGTPKCCSCERLEPRGTNYVMLGDGRWLCLECMDSAVIDTDQGASLQIEIREFFEGLNMKIQKVFPFLLVEKQALNKAEEKEKIDYQYEVVTRGICLSEAQTVTSVIKKQSTGPNTQLIEIDTVSQKVVRNCEVTAILILYGLPRLLTGYILAHEMMHAYLRLNGHGNLNKVLEEGICQVLGHMWLDSQRYAPIRIDDSAASSSASRIPGASVPKKGNWSDFEKKLVEFCKNQIETDDSLVYGVGFRKVNDMVTNIGLRETLRKITGG